jgi:molecular chaperone DnaK
MVKAEVEDAVRGLKQSMERNDISNLRQQTEVLTQASHKMAQSMYQQTGSSGTNRQPENHYSPGERSNSNDEVVDTEYEEAA